MPSSIRYTLRIWFDDKVFTEVSFRYDEQENMLENIRRTLEESEIVKIEIEVYKG